VKRKTNPIIYAMLAAVCYGVSTPVSKVLLKEIPPAMMASLLYLGAAFGMGIISFIGSKKTVAQTEAKLSKKDMPYIISMILLDIAAPILLMIGISSSAPANASLLNNFEIVATTLIACLIFKENIGMRMTWSLVLIVISSMILSMESGSFTFSKGSLIVILASTCWGIENNCTRMLSMKDPLQIVIVKGVGSGIGSLIIAIVSKGLSYNASYILFALMLGFFAYGLSIFFYIKAQRELGAARTSAYYAIAPFVGAALSMAVFNDSLNLKFYIALVIMSIGAYLAAFEKHGHKHIHETHEHDHRHSHGDNHHDHIHEFPVDADHSHVHTHERVIHTHTHTLDIHHSHSHN